MEELEKLVAELEAETNEELIEKKLQEIGAKLIKEYEIKVGSLIIKPLLVEAYYYNEKKFPDCNTHMNSIQKEFNELYRHSVKAGLKSDGRVGGVDICLALNNNKDETYYLSYLIKNSLVDGAFCKQVELNSKINNIHGNSDLYSNVLQKSNKKFDKPCIYLKRKGLTRECFRENKLAVVYPWNNINDAFSLESENKIARKKQWRIALSNIERGNTREMANQENGSKIEDSYWDLAFEDFDNAKLIEELK